MSNQSYSMHSVYWEGHSWFSFVRDFTLTPETSQIPVISPVTHVQSSIPYTPYNEKDTPESQSSQSINLTQLPYPSQLISPLTHQIRCNHEQNCHECQSETITSISVLSLSQVIYTVPHGTPKQLRPLLQIIQGTPIGPRSKSICLEEPKFSLTPSKKIWKLNTKRKNKNN